MIDWSNIYTSRTFIADPQAAPDITGVDFNLIYRNKVILAVISRDHKVDLRKLADYGIESANFILSYICGIPWHQWIIKSLPMVQL